MNVCHDGVRHKGVEVEVLSGVCIMFEPKELKFRFKFFPTHIYIYI